MRKPATAVFVLGVMLVAPAVLSAQPTRPLTLQEAQQLALQRQPAIKAGEATARAAGESAREARSLYLPTAVGAITAADASAQSTRIAAGALNNPTVIDRLAT